MKNRIGLAVIALAGFSLSQAQVPPTAEKLMSESTVVAKKEGKAVWVIFHASW